jgi:hypothetical protein
MNEAQLQQYNEIKEIIAKLYWQTLHSPRKYTDEPITWESFNPSLKLNSYKFAESILRIDGIAIINKDQSSPNMVCVTDDYDNETYMGIGFAQAVKHYTSSGFKKVFIPKEKE